VAGSGCLSHPIWLPCHLWREAMISKGENHV
jgi:hypothetical protein